MRNFFNPILTADGISLEGSRIIGCPFAMMDSYIASICDGTYDQLIAQLKTKKESQKLN